MVFLSRFQSASQKCCLSRIFKFLLEIFQINIWWNVGESSGDQNLSFSHLSAFNHHHLRLYLINFNQVLIHEKWEFFANHLAGLKSFFFTKQKERKVWKKKTYDLIKFRMFYGVLMGMEGDNLITTYSNYSEKRRKDISQELN